MTSETYRECELMLADGRIPKPSKAEMLAYRKKSAYEHNDQSGEVEENKIVQLKQKVA